MSSHTEASLRAVLVAGETLEVEFKSDHRRQVSPEEIYENIVCLANTQGGLVLIGVENDGSVTGLNAERPPKWRDPQFLKAAIFSNTVPPINARVSRISLPEGDVIALDVDAYPTICATGNGRCLRRVSAANGPECRPYYPHEHRSQRVSLGLEDLTGQTIDGANWDDLDPLEIDRLRRMIQRAGGDHRLLTLDDQALMQALRLVESKDGALIPVIAGLLLVGREERLRSLVPTNRTAFQVFRDDTHVTANDVMYTPLLRQIDALEERFEARRTEQEIMVGMLRMPVPEYAKDAYREAINNAVIHRDYALLGTIHVQWHADHIAITSPGGFPPGITTKNLLTHEPKPRNPRLAEACARIGLIESSARGVDRIYLGQLQYGRPLPDYSSSDALAVRLILHGGKANLEFIRLIHEASVKGAPLKLDDLIILNQLERERQIDLEEARGLLQKSDSQTRMVLDRLIERGFIEGRGTKQRRYILSASIYRMLGKSVDYVRMSGMETALQEAMVIEHVKAHGAITRREAASLCGIADDDAKSLLRRMADGGKLDLIGEKRGAHYVLSEKPPLNPISGQSLIQIIQDMLTTQESMSLQEIDDELARRGYEVAGANKRNYLTGIMSRNKALFQGIGKGRYRQCAQNPDR